MSAAPMFSAIRSICFVPGIGTIRGFCASSQARAMRAGVVCLLSVRALTYSTSTILCPRLSGRKREMAAASQCPFLHVYLCLVCFYDGAKLVPPVAAVCRRITVLPPIITEKSFARLHFLSLCRRHCTLCAIGGGASMPCMTCVGGAKNDRHRSPSGVMPAVMWSWLGWRACGRAHLTSTLQTVCPALTI